MSWNIFPSTLLCDEAAGGKKQIPAVNEVLLLGGYLHNRSHRVNYARWKYIFLSVGAASGAGRGLMEGHLNHATGMIKKMSVHL